MLRFPPFCLCSVPTVTRHHTDPSQPITDASGSMRLSEEAQKRLRPLKKRQRANCNEVSARQGINIELPCPIVEGRGKNIKPPARSRFPITGGFYSIIAHLYYIARCHEHSRRDRLESSTSLEKGNCKVAKGRGWWGSGS